MKMTEKQCKATRKYKVREPPLEYQPIAFVQESVRKAGSSCAERFERYKLARTIHEARLLGASSDDLQRDLRIGVLVQGSRISELAHVKAIKLFAPADNELISFAPNPKRPGFAAYARYERYSKAKTLQEAKKRGIWPGDIAHDMRSGFLGTSLTPFSSMEFRTYTGSNDCKKPQGSSPAQKNTRRTVSQRNSVGKCTASKEMASVKGVKKLGRERKSRKKSSFARAWAASIKAAPLAWTKEHGWA